MRKNFRVYQYLHTFLYRKNGTSNSYFYIGVVEGFSVTSRRDENCRLPFAQPCLLHSGPSPSQQRTCMGRCHARRLMRSAAFGLHATVPCAPPLPTPAAGAMRSCRCHATQGYWRSFPPAPQPHLPPSCCGASCRSQTLHPRHRPTTTPWLHPSWQCQALVPTHCAARLWQARRAVG